jgi:hypothetical protein
MNVEIHGVYFIANKLILIYIYIYSAYVNIPCKSIIIHVYY